MGVEGLARTPQDHSKVSKGSSPASFDCISTSSKCNMKENEFFPQTPEVIIKDNILSKIANMEQQQQSQQICTRVKMSSSDSDEDTNASHQRPMMSTNDRLRTSLIQ